MELVVLTVMNLEVVAALQITGAMQLTRVIRLNRAMLFRLTQVSVDPY